VLFALICVLVLALAAAK